MDFPREADGVTVNGFSLHQWLSFPFDVVIELMKDWLLNPVHCQSFEECNSAIDILLTCLCVNGGKEIIGLEGTVYTEHWLSHSIAAAELTKSACLSHPNICSVLFHHFPSVPYQNAFIQILPSIMLVCPDYALNDAFDVLLLLSENSEFTVSVLSMLLDIDLSLVRKQKVVELIERIMSSTSEAEFPPLFKLIFANLPLFSGSSLVKKLRTEVL